MPPISTRRSSSPATRSATRSFAGARKRFRTSASCRPTPASFTRSTSNTSRAWSSRRPPAGHALAYPDTLVGTDSHTTMVNGLGVVGWGVGGIEAEAAMLGQPISMLIPEVVGLPARRSAAGRRDRHRPRAHDHRAAAQVRRGRQVRRVLWARPRVPDDCRSRDARQHVAGIRRHDRDLPDRRDDARLSAPHRPRRSARADWSKRTRRNRDSSEPRIRSIPSTPRRWSSISRRSSRASPDRSVRRIACRCGSRSTSSSRRSM